MLPMLKGFLAFFIVGSYCFYCDMVTDEAGRFLVTTR
jgi:hypothetical protein